MKEEGCCLDGGVSISHIRLWNTNCRTKMFTSASPFKWQCFFNICYYSQNWFIRCLWTIH